MGGVFECKNCDRKLEILPITAKCDQCNSLLEYKMVIEDIRHLSLMDSFTFWRYNPFFPSITEKNRLNWKEGGTPLIHVKNLARNLAISNLFLKDETKNPTNSYSDRAASLILSYGLEKGYNSVVCASNGNSGASVAAYSARSPLTCKIIVPKKVAIGKLAQMHIFSENIFEYGESLDNAIIHSEDLSINEKLFQVTPEVNPIALEAQATIAYEIAEKFKEISQNDLILVPVGSGGLIWSLWRGFKTFYELNFINDLPRMVGIQAAGCAPVVKAYESELEVESLVNPSTNALELLVGNPYWGAEALSAIKESKGLAISVTDGEIIEAEKILARSEGIFAESASSATIAGVKKLLENGIIDESDRIICLITGSGLKEPYILKAISERPKIIGQKISTKLEILRILEVNESYGYKIWQDLGALKSIQSIYQHLSELESKELIIGEQIKNKRVFGITERGLQVLAALETLVDLL
ncbi:MAG: threonine synthase [Promethearchaeota archaeon]|nr:MAG: threonine synthase [Candidatus Lokiarchaeota archaeon]